MINVLAIFFSGTNERLSDFLLNWNLSHFLSVYACHAWHDHLDDDNIIYTLYCFWCQKPFIIKNITIDDDDCSRILFLFFFFVTIFFRPVLIIISFSPIKIDCYCLSYMLEKKYSITTKKRKNETKLYLFFCSFHREKKKIMARSNLRIH